MFVNHVKHFCKTLIPFRQLYLNPKLPCSTIAQQLNVNKLGVLQDLVSESQHMVIIAGSGVSVKSNIPVYKGDQDKERFRRYIIEELASTQVLAKNPALLWEFYHYLRELILDKEPNYVQEGIKKCVDDFESSDRKVSVLNQCIAPQLSNILPEVINVHGNVGNVKCTACNTSYTDTSQPLCNKLRNTGDPSPWQADAIISKRKLPSCKECGGFLRPDVVLLGESVDKDILNSVSAAITTCDLCLVVGTGRMIYPGCNFAAHHGRKSVIWLNEVITKYLPQLAVRGIPVAYFDTEVPPGSTSNTLTFNQNYHDVFLQALNT